MRMRKRKETCQEKRRGSCSHLHARHWVPSPTSRRRRRKRRKKRRRGRRKKKMRRRRRRKGRRRRRWRGH
jgi:hypothetical protein